MAFRDSLKKYREEQASQTTSSASSTTPSGTDKQSTSGTSGSGSSGSSFRDSLAKYRASQIAGSSAQEWLDTSISLINDIQNRSQSWYDNSEYLSQHERITTQLSQADAWRKKYAGDDEAIAQIDSVVEALTKAKDYSFHNYNYYSQWKSAEEYQPAYERMKQYYDQWGHYADAEDFEEYKGKGTNVTNPSWEKSKAPVDIFGWKPLGDGEDVYNMVTFAESNSANATTASAQAIRGGGATDEETQLVNAINLYMKDDEKDIYNYLIGKGETEKAREYLKYLEDTFAQREAGIIVEQIDDTALEAVFSLLAGTDSFVSGVKNLDNYATGDEADTKTSIQYAQEAMGSNNTGVWKYTNAAINTIGNMAPSILVGTITGGVGGAIAMGASVTGNAYSQALDRGYEKWQAAVYGTLVGVAEAALQYAIGGIANLAGPTGKISAKVLSKIDAIDKSLFRISAKIGWETLKEIGEEELQNYLEPLFRTIIAGEEYDAPTAAELFETAIVTFLSTGALEGPGIIARDVETSKYYKDKYGNSQTELIEQAFDGGEEFANPLAQKYKQKLDNGESLTGHQIGRLVEANEQQFRSEDMASIQTAAESRLTELGETGDVKSIAAALAKQAQYQSDYNNAVSQLVAEGIPEAKARKMASKNVESTLSKSEENAITNSKYGQRVANELNPDKIKSGNYASSWAENIGTERINTDAYNADLMALAMEKSGASAQTTPNASKAGQLHQGEKIVPTEGNLTTTAENGPESHYEVSADGKTLDAKGNEITITGIASVGKGKLTLKLSDGGTIDSSEVAYSSKGEALIYEAVANMDAFVDADTAFKLVKAYDPTSGISAEVYARGLNQAYTYGFYGYKRSDMTAEGALSAVLTEEQRNYAYEAGREYAEKHTEGKATGIKDAYATAKSILRNREKNGETVDKSGNVIFEDGLTQEQITKSKNGKQKNVAYLVAQKVSNKMGNDIHLYKGTKEFGFRAKDGDIWLNVNATADAQSMMLFTLSHELVHNAREYDPAGFKAFADALVEQYGEHGKSVHDMVLAKQADYASQGKKLSYDKAYEEVVCDACERMLLDSNALEKLQLIEQKHPGIIDRIIEGIRNFLNHIREIFADVSPYADESKFVKEMETEAQEILNRLFENMMVDSGKHYSTIKAAFGKGTVVETNANGEFTIAKSEDGSEMLYNLATWEKGGKETLQEALEAEGFSDEDIKAAMTIMDAKYDLVKKLGDEFKEQNTANKATLTTDLKDGHAVLSAIVSNGDYPVNIDLLMVCKKRQAYQRVINRLCETGLIKDATLDSLAIAEINRILGSNGFETACLGCFVESRRLRIQEWANTIVKEWNGLVDKKVGKGNAKAFNFSNEKAFVENMSNEEIQGLAMELDAAYEENRLQYGKTSVVKKMAKLIDEVPSLRRHLSIADLITPEGRTRLRSLSSELNSLVACRYGSNTPKIIQAFNPYNHELAVYGKVPSKYNSLREYLYAIGGARMQSFSDFIIENWFDYCQIVADLAARKLPMHTYTKEIALVKLLGMTGIKINMSLIPDVDNRLSKEYAGLTINEKGELELIWADKDRNKATGGKSYMQSINFADAVAIQNDPRYSSNVGTIAVGISVKQIEMMLDDPRIRMIIPYHSSGMNPIFAHLVGTSFYKDFTDVQNTKVKQLYKDGKPVSLKLTKDQAGKLTSGFEFNEVLQELGDARAAADAYKAWCADSSKHSITINDVTYTAELTPKFSQFAEHQNYYKVLEDFNTYDSITEKAAPQGDVTQTYPEDFEDILRAELTAQDKYRQKQEKNGSFDKAMAEIESYLETHTKADTVYYAEKNGIKLSDKDKKLDAAEKQKLKALRDADFKMPKAKTSPTYEELIAKDPISVVDIGQNSDGLSYAKLKEMVMKDVRERKIFDFPHPNKDTNVMIFLTEQSFTHAFSNLTSTFGEDTILAMGHIPEIIHEAVLANIAPPKNPRKAESRVFTFFAAIEGKNGIEPVKLTVKEYVGRKASEIPQNIRRYFEENGDQETHNRLYDAEVLEVVAVEGIKKESGASASVANRKRLGAKGTPNSTIKIADLLGLVNGDAKKYIPLPMTDSNGKQLTADQQEYFEKSSARDSKGRLQVVYHGGTVEYEFDTTRGGNGQTQYGPGSYFTDSEYYAKEYTWYRGGDVRPYYLNIEKMFDDTDMSATAQMPEWSKLEDILRKNGIEEKFIKRFADDGFAYMSRYLAIKAGAKTSGSWEGSDKLNAMIQEAGFHGIKGYLNDAYQYVIFTPNQAKLTTNEVPSTFYDTRYKLPNTLRDAQAAATMEALEKQNEKLREDVSYLKELLKLQKSVTGGKKITRSSVEIVARNLKKEMDAKGNSLELAGYLNQLYSYIAESDELTWEGIVEKAQPAVAWLREHGNVDKDSPTELSDQELLRKVYDGYWNVSTLYTVADVKQKEINKLKAEHMKRMQNMRESHKESIANLKQQQKQRIEDLRKYYHESTDKKLDATKERYQEQRQRGIENRNKTEMRKKIRKVIRDLDKILNRGNKKTNVKEDMKDFVAEALASAEILFTDTYTNEDMIRNGVGTDLTAEESKHMEEAKTLMEQIANLPSGSYEAMIQRQEAEEKLKSKLAYRMSMLRDVFVRERARLNKAQVSEVLGNLADAYAKLETSEYDYVNGAYHDAVYQYLKMLQDDVGGTKVKDMTLGQVEELHKAYTMVLTTVQNANKMFAEDLKQSKEELANRVMMEVYKAGGEHGLWSKGQLSRNQASWNNTKPIYAAERVGSSTFTKLVNGLFKGQYGWATDMDEARKFRQEIADKYGFKSWDMEKLYKFTSSSGIDFELNLNHIMALYAYAKRNQAHEHLLKGGFVFGKNTEVVVTKNGIKRTMLNKSAKAHNISDEIMSDIVSKLSDEQKGYVDEMQDYLSTTMGAKGNEVSLRLYGVKLFMEKFYFPLRSAGQFKEKAKEADQKQQQGQISIANSGFTHSTKPKASNPVVLDGFTDVWASHVNEMCLYHSMVLPMEDFRRVYNYASPNMEGQESASVNSFIENAYGDAATGYFDQLYKELNGGAIIDPRENLSKKMIGRFKKAAVMLSNSVWIQQFSAIGRAYALIDPKYFVGAKVDKKRHKFLWDEMKKYAPVVIIKEMGGFDTHTGGSATDFLLAENYGKGERIKGFINDKQYRDEIMGKAPALADELTWCAIWEAVKRETMAKNNGMDVRSEEFLKKAGERFSEVIEKTQVYDSVLARSANMRSKQGLMQMLTAFMAEPTTTINMIEDALRKGNKKVIARTFGAVAASIILNNALASIVYAMRDDDEDETFLEKYAQAFTSGMLDDINPMTYYPILKDIWSLFQGYDVERTDMAIYSDIADAVKKIVTLIAKYDSDMDESETAEHNKKVADALMSLLDAGASAFGVPLRNVRRDLMSYYNAFNTLSKDLFGGRDTTWHSYWDAVGGSAIDSIPIVGLVAGESKQDKLYDAIVSGDNTYLDRLKSSYKTEAAYDIAVRKALRENDPRIKEAAEARFSGDYEKYKEIFLEIKGEGNFSFDTIMGAINNEVTELEKKAKSGTTEETTKADENETLFKVEHYYTAVVNGDQASAKLIYDDLIADKVAEGYLKHEAEDAIASGFATQVGQAYMDGEISRSKALQLLEDNTDKGETQVKKWDFELEYGFSWGERVRKYRLGQISEGDLISAVMDIEGESRKNAKEYIEFLDLEMANANFDITANDASGYFEYAEPAGINIEVYLDYKDKASKCESDKDANGKPINGTYKAKVMDVIHSLPLSISQKDALYFANGWSKSNLNEAPWH